MTERRETRPDGVVELEQHYKMNLLTNREAVIEALIVMEGRDWYEKFQPKWREHSIEGALENALNDGVGVIYGSGGSHRYVVEQDGRVIYLKDFGSGQADKAGQLGFECN
ncbi:hypothetical protein HY626_03900 [Candidatus Uhrbacteria bacterium]|nr:hypothetical protein [Candidatus Uhrbacteria bacterium]